MNGTRDDQSRRRSGVIQDPPFARMLFEDTRFVWLWLAARTYLGWHWLAAGRHKLSDDAWMDGGLAVRRFWEQSVNGSESSRQPIAYDWYRSSVHFMLDHAWYEWLAPAIAIGETLIGIALILGLFTGIVAFLGSFLNVSLMLVGSAAIDPILFILAITLMLAWKTAGWIGLDHWVLPIVGASWLGSAGTKKGANTGQRRRPAQVAN